MISLVMVLHAMRISLQEALGYLFDLSEKDSMPLAGQFIKLTEEVGELSVNINYHLGLSKKVPDESLIGEIADVISCAISVLVKAYPGTSQDCLRQYLTSTLMKKGKKWEDVMVSNTEKESDSNLSIKRVLHCVSSQYDSEVCKG